MSEENVAIVKASWAGWRQGLHDQWVRDLDDGLEERMREWTASADDPELQPEEFVDEGEVILVRARILGREDAVWFRYEMNGRRIANWSAHDDEAAAREG